METFLEYLQRRDNEIDKKLGLIKKALRKKGFTVEDFIDSNPDDPYVFVENPLQSSTIGGIRIYPIAGGFSFRVQKNSKSHPYGKSYDMDFEGIFEGYLSEMGAKEAAEKLIEDLAKDINAFFRDSKNAENEIGRSNIDGGSGDPLGRILLRSTGTDYADNLFKKGTNYGGAI